MTEFWRDDRAVSAVVEKLLGTGLALLYIGATVGLLLGSVVPGYQTAAGEELGERTLATAADEVEQATPRVEGSVNSTTTVELPSQIAGATYRLVLADGTLTLAHPDGRLREERELALPANAETTRTTWTSGDTLRIRVTGPGDNRTVALGGSR